MKTSMSFSEFGTIVGHKTTNSWNLLTADVEKDDHERARFQYAKIFSGRNKSQESSDGGNTGDEGKIISGAIGACGGIGDSSLVASYACMTFIYGSLWKGMIASEAKTYLDKSFEGSEEVFPNEDRK
nr:hypothetical protein [Tanacetum cinerariifolium]